MAKGFLRLREHPRYKTNIMDAEIKLLKDNSPHFLKEFENKSFNLVDMGCADGTKSIEIISSLPKSMKIRYCPVSINDYLVNLALDNVKKKKFSHVLEYSPQLSSDFESLDQVSSALRNNKYQKNALLLLGSLLASFEINDYLFRLSRSMFGGDVLIIGNGIRKGQRFANLETYKSPVFNEWLIHLMRQLGFKDEEVQYDARFENNRLEGFYKVKTDKTIASSGKKVEFKAGDEVVVVFQYKLYANELKDFCSKYFEKVELVEDPAEEYAIVKCVK